MIYLAPLFKILRELNHSLRTVGSNVYASRLINKPYQVNHMFLIVNLNYFLNVLLCKYLKNLPKIEQIELN